MSPLVDRRGSADEAPAGTEARTAARSPARTVVALLVTFVVLGAVCGAAWSQLVTPAEFTKVAAGGSMGEDQLGREFGADGWYVVIALAVGLLTGVLVTGRLVRAPLRAVGVVVVGSCLTALVCAVVGRLLGPADPGPVLAAVRVGAHVPQQVRVDAVAVYLVWPLAALLGALLVLVGPDRSRSRWTAEP